MTPMPPVMPCCLLSIVYCHGLAHAMGWPGLMLLYERGPGETAEGPALPKGGTKGKNYAKSREIGIPNNSRISVFTFYLANLVYRVGFVIGVLFKTHLSNGNFIDFLTLW